MGGYSKPGWEGVSGCYVEFFWLVMFDLSVVGVWVGWLSPLFFVFLLSNWSIWSDRFARFVSSS